MNGKSNIVLDKSVFGQTSNFSKRYISDYKKLQEVIGHCKGLGLKVVLTQGTYDMVHIGHARYLEELTSGQAR